MRSTASVTLVLFGIALGFVWAGGCSDENKSVAAPTAAASSGTPLLCYVGAPSTGGVVWSLSGGGAGTEDTIAMPAPRAGTLKNLYVAPTLAFGSGSVSVTVRKNGVDTSLLLVYGTADGTGLKSNTTDSVTVAEGDVLSIRFLETTGTGTPGGVLKASVLFE